jgi:hypothetical protein
METTLLGAGLGCIVAAVVGGGLKAFGIEFPLLTSRRRQAALGTLGVLLASGGVALSRLPTPASAVGPPALDPAPPPSQSGGEATAGPVPPQKLVVTIPEQNFWLTLPRPVSELRGRLHVWSDRQTIAAQVRVVHESGPDRDRLLDSSRRGRLYTAPSGFRICPLKLPGDSEQHILGLMQYCKQGEFCSYTFPDAPDSSRVNVRLHGFSATIVRGGEVCD